MSNRNGRRDHTRGWRAGAVALAGACLLIGSAVTPAWAEDGRDDGDRSQDAQERQSSDERPGERPDGWRGGRGGPPGPPDGGRGHGDHRPDKPLSEDELRGVVDAIKRINPEMGERLDAQLERDPRRAAGMIQRALPRLRGLLELRRRDPAMFELRVEDLRVMRLIFHERRQYLAALEAGDDEAAAEHRQTLEGLVAEHFDLRLRAHEMRIERLEEELASLQRRLEQQKAQKQAWIDKRLEFLTSDRWPGRPDFDGKHHHDHDKDGFDRGHDDRPDRDEPVDDDERRGRRARPLDPSTD